MKGSDIINKNPILEKLSFHTKVCIANAMEEYARKKCKEQREICARQVSGFPNKIKTESEIEEDVENAPEPKFD